MQKVLNGDCLEVLRDFPDDYFDSLLIDPPAGIAFMGKDWDKDKKGMLNWINWLSEILAEVNRTLKPGALGLVWSIPRTSHWTGMAIELAGFRIVDILHHANGSGFPKAQDIGKLIDNMAGAEREVVGRGDSKTGKDKEKNWCVASPRFYDITAPATPEAQQWDGWKTPALKPAVEDWWLVQKKCSESSIARNILKHGVGGLNIEAARVGTDVRKNPAFGIEGWRKMEGRNDIQCVEPTVVTGRYPANLILSCGSECDGANHSPDCPVTVIGDQSGRSSSNWRKNKGNGNGAGIFGVSGGNTQGQHDSGTSARYFKQLPFDPETTTSIYYQAKASKSDRTCGGQVPNVHPTVKSRHLIAYFLKLITPPGGVVLDCFGGSGTTAVAAIENGFNYCLIEKEPQYIDIINQRIAATQLPLFPSSPIAV